MRIFAILALLTLSIQSFASDYTCTVISNEHPELTRGINKDTICRESFYAIKSDLTRITTKMKIFVTARSMYSVSLLIENTDENNQSFSNQGVLHWYPGDEYVILRK